MTGKYYYLVASLPYLTVLESKITKKAFLEECSKWLSVKDFSSLKKAGRIEAAGKSFDVPALAAWKRFEEGLTKELFAAREAIVAGTPIESSTNEGVKAVFDQETPLLMEQKLAQVKFDFIDGEFNKYYFDLNWLILYYLKIQILERLKVFNKDDGEKFFYELCEVNYEN